MKLKEVPKKVHKLMMVYWQDAYVTTDDDVKLDGVGNNLTATVGWFVKKDKKFKYYSNFFDGICHELGSPYTAIPLGMIKEEYELELQDN